MAKLSLSLFLVFCFLFFTTLVVSCGDVEMALSSLTVTPSAATVGISQPQAFSVIARDSGGYLQNITPVWSLTGGIGSISAAGLFEASGTAGSGYVVATYGGISKQAAVTITERCWIEGQVTGARDASGVQFIVVGVRGASYSDYTNSSGNYSIAGLPAGTYEVYTPENHAIYNSSSSEVTLVSGETVTANFSLTVRPGVPEFTTTTFPDLFYE